MLINFIAIRLRFQCVPEAHDDSFDSTEPFGFNSATYFLPLSTLIGVALASTFIGKLSDKHGRKILLLILGWISAAGSIVKYYSRDTFWGFCAACFAFGFFLGEPGNIFPMCNTLQLKFFVLTSSYALLFSRQPTGRNGGKCHPLISTT